MNCSKITTGPNIDLHRQKKSILRKLKNGTLFKKMISFLTLCLIIILSLCPETADAKTYRYIDNEGIVHFTDDPSYLRKNIAYTPPSPSKKKIIASQLPRLSSNLAREELFTNEISAAAKKYDIDPHLIKAVIKAESDFNPYAVSHKGALGLMQLIPATAKRYKVKKPFNPEQNINGGVHYLKNLFSLFNGNIKKVIAAYNAGENMVIKYNGIPPFKETQLFVKRVISYYKTYRKAGKENKVFTFTSKEGTIVFTDSPWNPLSFK